MNFKHNMMAAVLVVGVAWNLAGAAESDTEKFQAELVPLCKLVKSQPGDLKGRMELNRSLLESGETLLKKYEKTVPVACVFRYTLVQRVMMTAAERLYQDAPTPEYREKLRAAAKAVIALPVHDPAMWVGVRGYSPAPDVAQAGKLLATLDIYETPGAAPKDAAKHIRAMIELFPDKPEGNGAGDLHKQAMVYALQLAMKTGEKELAKELGDIVANKCLDTKFALDTLTEAGHPMMFTGELTTLDGKKLTFPQDAQGKVVLLDFWATWCGPCRAALPHLKELHEKYKDRNVWIIGVSCDVPGEDESAEQNKQKVRDFVAKNDCAWTQTYAGEWPAVASKYGINTLPTVMLLDQQGRVVSATARGREEQLIEQTLAAVAGR